MPLKMSIDAGDVKGLAVKLRALSKRQSRAIVRRGLQAGSTPTLKRFRANVKAYSPGTDGADAEFSTGTLAASVGRRVTTSRRTGKSFVVIGAIRGVEVKTAEPDGREVTRRPSRYLHLLELGTAHSAPVPLLQEAIDATREDVTRRTLEFIERGTVRELRRQLSRNGSAAGMALADIADTE